MKNEISCSGGGKAEHSSIALGTGVPMTAGRGHREGGIFFQKTGMSVHEEGMVGAKEVWAETGTSTGHLHVFTTWSHHWLIIETIPAVELRISYQKRL